MSITKKAEFPFSFLISDYYDGTCVCFRHGQPWAIVGFFFWRHMALIRLKDTTHNGGWDDDSCDLFRKERLETRTSGWWPSCLVQQESPLSTMLSLQRGIDAVLRLPLALAQLSTKQVNKKKEIRFDRHVTLIAELLEYLRDANEIENRLVYRLSSWNEMRRVGPNHS